MRKSIILLFLSVIPIVMSGQRHYTVVVSLDGFRWDYPLWYATPFFDQMAAEGAEANLIPSFPSKTFPNHFTLATGLYPDHHGIIANSFFDPATERLFSLSDPEAKLDPSFYNGEPIWNTAERQGVRTAIYYWAGSDVAIGGIHPWRYFNYDVKKRLSFEERIEGIISMLNLPEEERPGLIMAYFEQPDANGHSYGPQSKQTRDAVQKMDKLMKTLYEGIKALPVGNDVNFIVVSDHGMTTLTPGCLVNIEEVLNPDWLRASEGNNPANLYVNPGCKDSVFQALKSIDHVKYWYKEDIPSYLHFGTNARIGDIVVMPDLGWLVDTKLQEWGTHGYDPTYNDMHALMRAVGPDIEHINHGDTRNVNVYGMICLLLNIEPAPNDGCEREIADMLKPRVQERMR